MDQEPLYYETLITEENNQSDPSFSSSLFRRFTPNVIQWNENSQSLSLTSFGQMFRAQHNLSEDICGSVVQMGRVLRQNCNVVESLATRMTTLEQKVASGQRNSNVMLHSFADQMVDVTRRITSIEQIVANNFPRSSETLGETAGGSRNIGETVQNYAGTNVDTFPENGGRLSTFLRQSKRGHLELIPPQACTRSKRTSPMKQLGTQQVLNAAGQIEINECGRYICPNCRKTFASNYVLTHVEKGICQGRRKAANMTQL